MRKALVLAFITLATVSLLCIALARAVRTPPPCAGAKGGAIVVDALEGRMHLCEKGRSAKVYPVALGSGGLGKRKQGDAKTPLGIYPVGAPRKSDDYHIFIPVGYPTEEQKAAGYTGGDIGIHGPKRKFRWLGRLNSTVDWTLGCLAVGRDSEIREVADWVERTKPEYIQILNQ